MRKSKLGIIDAIVVLFIAAIIVAGIMTTEKDPEYMPQPATYYGKPAFTQLHRPQGGVQYITFYAAENAAPDDDFINNSSHWVIGRKICTVPTEMAIEMYHHRAG